MDSSPPVFRAFCLQQPGKQQAASSKRIAIFAVQSLTSCPDCTIMPIAIAHTEDHVLSSVSIGRDQVSLRQRLVSFDKNTRFPSKPLSRAREISDACYTSATEDASLDSDSIEETLDLMERPAGEVAEKPFDIIAEEDFKIDAHELVEEKKSDDVAELKPAVAQGKKARRPFAIKRSSLLEEIPVKQGRCTWKQLPKLDLEKIRSVTRGISEPAPQSPQLAADTQVRRQSSVVFHEVVIRNYDQTIGDNPSVSYGPPISLDWAFEENEPILLDDYENNRGPRRNTRQMILNYYNRRNLLMWRCGATEEELKQAEKDVNKIKNSRSLTKALLPAQKLEEALQSFGRKTKRLTGRKSKS